MTYSEPPLDVTPAPIPRPRAVDATVVLLWFGLILQLADLPGQWRGVQTDMPDLALLPTSFVLASGALTAAAYGGTVIWLNIKLVQRRNWARITCLGSAALELAFGIPALAPVQWTSGTWWASLASNAMSIAMVVLLTRQASRSWFGSR
jgi:hypothetical protein